jgi:aminoglycoside phosphotransferase family enzyme/predicted kinase
MAARDEPSLIQALQDPSLYPHPVSGFEVIETHISWVLLTGTCAYKIRKPVDLGFLDFTSLERRRHFCEEELRLNRRLAPDLYLELVRITGSAQSPNLDGPGPVIEYAVKMRQFDPSLRFDRLLATGRLDARLISELAATLARFHERAQPARPDDPWGDAESIMEPARDNFIALTLPDTLAAERLRLERLAMRLEEDWERLEAVCARRKSSGRIRECHGDLHLANVTLYEGKATPFDCLEFDPALRWIDVISEIAFLAMDLDAHGRPDLTCVMLNEYLHHSGDYEGLALLRFYQCYRAMVRAKVECIRARQRGEITAAGYREVLGYVRLAETYARERRGAVVITHGLSGSGKTTLGGQLLAQCRLIRIRSDVERKRLAGYAPQARTQSGISGGIYTPQASERTYRRLEELTGIMAAAGFNVLVDATFLRRTQRDAFRLLAARLRVPFVILHFEAGEETLRERVRERGRAGTDASEADLEVLAHQLASQEPLTPGELSSTIWIDAGDTPDMDALGLELMHRIGGYPEPDFGQ